MTKVSDEFRTFVDQYLQRDMFRQRVLRYEKRAKEGKAVFQHPEIYVKGCVRRFIESYEWIEPFMRSGLDILELGYPNVFTEFLEHKHQGMRFSYLGDDDLRESISYPDGSFEFVLNMETLEHIKDQDGSEPKELVNFSGVNKFISECFRILRPDGRMFLSTPNALSYSNIRHLLIQKDPWLHFGHFKEYSKLRVEELLTKHGFQVCRIGTTNVVFEQGIDQIRELVLSKGFDDKDRGDTVFVIARKPTYDS